MLTTKARRAWPKGTRECGCHMRPSMQLDRQDGVIAV